MTLKNVEKEMKGGRKEGWRRNRIGASEKDEYRLA